VTSQNDCARKGKPHKAFLIGDLPRRLMYGKTHCSPKNAVLEKPSNLIQLLGAPQGCHSQFSRVLDLRPSSEMFRMMPPQSWANYPPLHGSFLHLTQLKFIILVTPTHFSTHSLPNVAISTVKSVSVAPRLNVQKVNIQ